MGKSPSRVLPRPRSFRSAKEFRAWLAKEHARAPGLLLRIYKKDSGVPSVTYAEALDQALCFGWIDGQKLPFDASSWVQKWTPRRTRSGWSKKNVTHVERLIREGQMTPAGRRVRFIRDRNRASRVPQGARSQRQGEGILRDAEQGQSVRDRLPVANSQASGDEDQAHQADHREARSRGDISLISPR
jgi:hypothetical protein